MRAALAPLGLVILAAVWIGPLPRLVPGSFAAHMTMHMAVVAIAAPLVSLGLAGSRFDPVRFAPRLLAPLPASLVELVVVWGWHAPALHGAARHDPLVFVVEQATFLASGLWLWSASFGRAAADRTAAGIVALLLTSMHMTLLGALLALPNRVLYAHGHAPPAGLTALEDQHLGGAIMLLVGGLAYLAGGLWLTARLVRPRCAGRAA